MIMNDADQKLKELEDYGTQIINKPEILINKFKTIDINDENIDTISPGTYRMSKSPSIGMLRSLPYYKDSSSEVGIICFNNNWFITLGDHNQFDTPFPMEFKILGLLGVLQFHAHSHPGKIKKYAHLPSDIDLYYCNNAIDQCQYIICESSFVEIRNIFPRIFNIKKLWSKWLIEDLKLTKERFESIGFTLLMTDFCNKYLNYNLISWEKKDKIMDILSSKESLYIKTDLLK